VAKNERLCRVEAAAPGCGLRSSLAAWGEGAHKFLPRAGNQRLGSGFSKVARTSAPQPRPVLVYAAPAVPPCRRGRSIIACTCIIN